MALAVVGIVAVLVGLRWARASVLRSLAAEHEGWSFDGTELRGPVGDGAIALTVSRSWIDMGWSVSVLSDWMDVRVVRLGPGVPERVDTGDKGLDWVACIEGRSRVVLATLSPKARAAIRRAIAYGFRCEGGVWSFESRQFSRSRKEFTVALAIAAELALRLEPPGDVSAALEERLAEEPDPSVALEMLRARLEDRSPLPEALHAELLARCDATTLMLAIAMEEEGLPHLLEVLSGAEHPGTRWEALNELWRRKHPDLGEALVSFLDSPFSDTAIERLGQVGTVKQVPPLRGVAERWFDGRGKAAERAIQAIQARARGEVGQLSLADSVPQQGAVSLAEQASARANKGQLER